MGDACFEEAGLELKERGLSLCPEGDGVRIAGELVNQTPRDSRGVDGLCESHAVGQVEPHDDVVEKDSVHAVGVVTSVPVVLYLRLYVALVVDRESSKNAATVRGNDA